jgi:hypothetical protein
MFSDFLFLVMRLQMKPLTVKLLLLYFFGAIKINFVPIVCYNLPHLTHLLLIYLGNISNLNPHALCTLQDNGKMAFFLYS